MNVNRYTLGSNNTNMHDVHLPRCAVTGKTNDLCRVKIIEGIENPYNYILLSKDIHTQFGKKFVLNPNYAGSKQDPRNSTNALVICNVEYDDVFKAYGTYVFKAYGTYKNTAYVPLGSIGFILLKYYMGLPTADKTKMAQLYGDLAGCTIENNHPYEPDGCALMLPFDYIN